MLPPDKRTRLIKLLGMLGSAYEGERANAASMIDRIMKEYKLTWTDVLGTATAAQQQPSPPAGAGEGRDDFDSWMAMHSYCTGVPPAGIYTGWEANFLDSVGQWLDRGWDLTEKQQISLRKIYNKARRHNAQTV